MEKRRSVRDELDIQRVVFDYAWACDNGDWGLLRSAFTEDAQLDYSSTGGPSGPRDEVVAWLEESLSQLAMIHHVVSNFRIDAGPDDAEAQAMFHTTVQVAGVEALLLTGGYYELRLTRTGGGWKLQRLVEDNRWMKPVAPAQPAG